MGNEDDGGLMDFGARFYDPRIGRFYSPDPIKDVSNANLTNPYTYCSNNPLRYTDKYGLRAAPNPDRPPEDGGGTAGGGKSRPNDPENMWDDLGGEIPTWEQGVYLTFSYNITTSQRDAIIALVGMWTGAKVFDTALTGTPDSFALGVAVVDITDTATLKSQYTDPSTGQLTLEDANALNKPGYTTEEGHSWVSMDVIESTKNNAESEAFSNYFYTDRDMYDNLMADAVAKIAAYNICHEIGHQIWGVTDPVHGTHHTPFFARERSGYEILDIYRNKETFINYNPSGYQNFRNWFKGIPPPDLPDK